MENRLERMAWLVVVGLALTGCVSAPPENTESLFVRTDFHAPLNTPLTAQTGDAVFVEGMFIHKEVMTLSQDLHTTLPGLLHVPFPVSIQKGELPMVSVRGGWKYFCAKDGTATVTFPGMGSMIAPGDCAGVRQSTTDGRLQWVVDNSIYNHATAIWARSVTDKEHPLLTRSVTGEPFLARAMKRIIFDGFYGGQFHFTFEDWETGARKDSKSFVFDRSPSGDTLVGIHGKVFRIANANNVQMTYQWVKF